MKTVKNPPKLVLQKTPNWCFAAAEVMIRAYYNKATLTQYAIARRATEARAAVDPQLDLKWALAQSYDEANDELENGGANLQSHIVKLVRGEWNIVDNDAIDGYNVPDLTPEQVLEEIANDRVFVVGNHNHYYVVYGCEDDGKTLYALDPYQRGNPKAKVALSTVEVAILFR